MQPDDLDAIYRDIPLEKIPWISDSPPDTLVNLVDKGMIRPCRAVDLGCGTGNYAIWLATRDFDVTGIDKSPSAIRLAHKNARNHKVRCSFVVADLLGDLAEIPGTFDFAFDYELLHHIFPEDRPAYFSNVHRLLNRGATYLSVCFSEQDPQFGGNGKVRKTPLKTILYFSSESEIRDGLSPYFEICSVKTIRISGKYGPHLAVCALSKRR